MIQTISDIFKHLIVKGATCLLAIERSHAIMELLEQNGSAMVSDLSVQLGVTEETIRRDLVKLERDKKISRVHGGAYLLKGGKRMIPVELRRRFFVEEKRRMAKQCIEMIRERDSIMLDSSTTALVLAQEIREAQKAVTVMTNSLDIVQELGSCDFVALICIGGRFRADNSSFRGQMALDNLAELYADKAFVSCPGVHLEFGLMAHTESDAKVRALMLSHARERILIADHTKFDFVAPHKITELKDVNCIVTDAMPDEKWRDALSEASIPLVVAN